MFGSKSDFFKQDTETLFKKRRGLENILRDIWERNDEVVKFYLEAYDYFVLNPDDFDGATIIKDVKVIKGLDIWAMIHDYLYIKYNVAVSWKYKYLADLIYAKEMEIMGQSAFVSWGRFGLLIIFGHLIFTPIELIKGKRMNEKQRNIVMDLYNKFY